MDSLTLLPGRGLGALFFGMTAEEVEEVIGRAPKAVFEEDGEYSFELWGYPDKDLALFFHRSEGGRLTSLEVGEDPRYSLFEEPLFPRNKLQMMALLRANLNERDLGLITESSLALARQTCFAVPTLGCTLYFNDQELLEDAQWYPLRDPRGEIIWPKRPDSISSPAASRSARKSTR